MKDNVNPPKIVKQQPLKKPDIPTWQQLEKQRKTRNLRLQLFENRETFLLSYPTANEASKSFANINGLLFAGSLTFLGLSTESTDIDLLRISWLCLAISIMMYLFVSIALLDSFMSHGRAESYTKRAQASIKNERNNLHSLIDGIKGHWNQKDFFRSIRYLVVFLILQFIFLLIGGVFMGLFILENL